VDQTPRLADAACKVGARFFRPPAGLERYFTSFYLAEIEVADGHGGGPSASRMGQPALCQRIGAVRQQCARRASPPMR
jgi:hypothetical protein